MKAKPASKANPATRVSACKRNGTEGTLKKVLVAVPKEKEDLRALPDQKALPGPRDRPVPAEVAVF
jgi:hypothetical protein